jgi:hypothetical protein
MRHAIIGVGQSNRAEARMNAAETNNNGDPQCDPARSFPIFNTEQIIVVLPDGSVSHEVEER